MTSPKRIHTVTGVLLLIISLCQSRRSHRALERAERNLLFDHLPLKPSKNHLIPLQLEEQQNSNLDPDLENGLSEYQLLKFMGSDFDRSFLSIRQPLDSLINPNGTLFYKFKKNQTPEGDMPSEIAALAGDSIKLTEEGLELRIKFSRRTKAKLQKFLWAYSYCPVRYKWTQLSQRFWPRWIKTGECDNQKSCSIPAGMYCKPSEMKNIKLLRYYCPSAKDPSTCQWIKIEYPVLDSCKCSCHNSN